MRLFWITQTVHFGSSLSLDGISQDMLRCITCTSWHFKVWSTNDKIHFASTLASVGQHSWRYILSPHWHGMRLVNRWWDEFGIVQHMLYNILCPLCHVGLWSTNVEINLVPWLTWDGFGQINVEIQFYSLLSWEGIGQYVKRNFVTSLGLINTLWDAFCILACMGLLWSTQGFDSSLK